MSRRERIMLMVLGGVAFVALVFFLLSRGAGDDGGDDEPTTTPPIVQPEPEPTVTGPPKLPPLAIFGGRDPFFPLISDAPVDGDGAAPSPSPTGGPAPTVSPAPPPANGDGTAIGGHDVNVLDIFIRDGKEFVQVEVDGKVFTVAEGETFADNFKVVSIDGRCATFLFGDEQFTECEPGVKK